MARTIPFTGPPPPRTDGQSTVMTTADAAALLGISDSLVRQWLRDGRLRGVKYGAYSWRVLRASVEALLPSPEPLIPAIEQALALLDDLSPGERLRVARKALDGITIP